METEIFSETSVITGHSTNHRNSEDLNVRKHCCEYLKPRNMYLVFSVLPSRIPLTENGKQQWSVEKNKRATS
jgi:hypothetical protein